MTLNEFNKRYNDLQQNIFRYCYVHESDEVIYTCNLLSYYFSEKSINEYKSIMSLFSDIPICVSQFGVPRSMLELKQINAMRFDCLEHFYWHCYHNELYKDW